MSSGGARGSGGRTATGQCSLGSVGMSGQRSVSSAVAGLGLGWRGVGAGSSGGAGIGLARSGATAAFGRQRG